MAKLRGRPVAVLAQGRVDAALGYGVLAVDALGVAPEQDFDAVPGPRGSLVGGTPALSHSDRPGVAEIVDPLGERLRLFFLGQRLAAGGGPRAR